MTPDNKFAALLFLFGLVGWTAEFAFPNLAASLPFYWRLPFRSPTSRFSRLMGATWCFLFGVAVTGKFPQGYRSAIAISFVLSIFVAALHDFLQTRTGDAPEPDSPTKTAIRLRLRKRKRNRRR